MSINSARVSLEQETAKLTMCCTFSAQRKCIYRIHALQNRIAQAEVSLDYELGMANVMLEKEKARYITCSAGQRQSCLDRISSLNDSIMLAKNTLDYALRVSDFRILT